MQYFRTVRFPTSHLIPAFRYQQMQVSASLGEENPGSLATDSEAMLRRLHTTHYFHDPEATAQVPFITVQHGFPVLEECFLRPAVESRKTEFKRGGHYNSSACFSGGGFSPLYKLQTSNLVTHLALPSWPHRHLSLCSTPPHPRAQQSAVREGKCVQGVRGSSYRANSRGTPPPSKSLPRVHQAITGRSSAVRYDTISHFQT